ncbi:MAG TPA: mycofactocin system transcriptional regulator [Acidimicrobiales bacterium]|nr:mycofactocin system transcriptional regulator [Acidimicrobiales bacterium]
MTDANPAGAGGTGVVDSPPTSASRGRRPSTTREQIARQALDLFDRDGFDATTVDRIATAAGISRRTFFRYYNSKRDVVWGEFDAELVRLRDQLVGAPRDEPMMDVLRRAVVATNRFGAGELDELRIRMGLISTVPALVAHSAVRYAEWCEVVADFVAGRIGGPPGGLGPQTVARAALGTAMAAFACWANHDTDDLTGEVDEAFRLLGDGFDEDRLRIWASQDRSRIPAT